MAVSKLEIRFMDEGRDLKETLNNFYTNEKLGCTNIAKLLNVTAMTIHSHLKKYNIETRSLEEALKIYDRSGEKNGMYGLRFTDEYKREQSERLKATIKTRGCHWSKGRVMPEAEKASHGRKGENSGNWKGGKHIKGNGYVEIKMPSHPHCDNRGYVYQHRLVMEELLGRYLTDNEIVHHIDEDKVNNEIENLRLFQSHREHAMEHHRIKKGMITE